MDPSDGGPGLLKHPDDLLKPEVKELLFTYLAPIQNDIEKYRQMNDAVQLPDEHREIFNKMMQEKIQNLDMAKTEALQKEEAEMADTAAIICRALPEYVLTNPASLKIQIPYLHTALSGAVMGYRAQALKQAQAVLKNLPKPQYHTNHRHLRAYEVLLGDPLTPEQPTRPSTPPPTPSRLTAPQSREDNLRFYKQMLEEHVAKGFKNAGDLDADALAEAMQSGEACATKDKDIFYEGMLHQQMKAGAYEGKFMVEYKLQEGVQNSALEFIDFFGADEGIIYVKKATWQRASLFESDGVAVPNKKRRASSLPARTSNTYHQVGLLGEGSKKVQFNLQTSIADGNCLPHSLELLCNQDGISSDGAIMRAGIVRYAEENWETVREQVQLDQLAHEGVTTKEQYIALMSGKTYMGDAELVMASRMLRSTIRVYQAANPVASEYHVQEFDVPDAVRVLNMLRTGEADQGHYQPMHMTAVGV